ncbi:MAG TPA: DUF1501 domain-containing protein, partial [Pirellulales bacterium]|nr:DUF1501 domain-containing protein [Pirellulales bacterium]
MRPTRRDFLGWGIGSSALVCCGSESPLFLARSAVALADAPHPASNGRVLVVVELNGGNDGLNTVVPYADDDYHRRRPTLAVAANQVHRLDDRIGLHPELGGLEKLFDRHELCIVQSVGYPNPNRSHFESMAIWQSGRLAAGASAPGWLGRVLESRPPAPGGDAPALHLRESATFPQALAAREHPVPSLGGIEDFQRRLGLSEMAGAGEQRAVLDELAALCQGERGSLLDFVERNAAITYAGSARLDGILHGTSPAGGYRREHGLARRLQSIAQMIKAGLTTSIYYTELGGFDTHAHQQGAHPLLLRQVGDSLRAFIDDLSAAGEARRVLVFVFSEFGRRLSENASGGTDHGT